MPCCATGDTKVLPTCPVHSVTCLPGPYRRTSVPYPGFPVRGAKQQLSLRSRLPRLAVRLSGTAHGLLVIQLNRDNRNSLPSGENILESFQLEPWQSPNNCSTSDETFCSSPSLSEQYNGIGKDLGTPFPLCVKCLRSTFCRPNSHALKGRLSPENPYFYD